MIRILVLGAGKIGSLIGSLLADSGDYLVHLCDSHEQCLQGWETTPNLRAAYLDARNRPSLLEYVRDHEIEAIVSALPFYCNLLIAEIAAERKLHYFDLTEDVEVTRLVKTISTGASTAFAPQCGLAPGFISIAASDLTGHFDTLDTVKLRVGALPVHPSNVLKYSLTWSTDGLINEYGNSCYGIDDGEEVVLMPLEGYETVEIDGLLYEAFNTSGGIGTLADNYAGKVKTMNYKTLRYPGHCEKIHFLMQDLKLKDDRETLKRILENAVPKTLHDVVLIYVSVIGRQHGDLFEENYVKKIYPETISGKRWSAIQITTASSLCAVADLVLRNPGKYKGFVVQESFALNEFLENRFGRYYR
ncbi:MAG: saccharopine dehydrogenase C-terminal domain-containing protein [Pseudomonadota bacterium]